jgi:inhibitor of cysteine peptidase
MKKIVLLAVSLFMITCASKPSITVNESFEGKEASVNIGEFFEVRLEGQPGTGYSWKLKSMPDIIVEKEKSFQEPKEGSKDKAGGFEYIIFRYTAVKEGSAELEFTYARHWEKDKPVQKTFKTKIIVIKKV